MVPVDSSIKCHNIYLFNKSVHRLSCIFFYPLREADLKIKICVFVRLLGTSVARVGEMHTLSYLQGSRHWLGCLCSVDV